MIAILAELPRHLMPFPVLLGSNLLSVNIFAAVVVFVAAVAAALSLKKS